MIKEYLKLMMKGLKNFKEIFNALLIKTKFYFLKEEIKFQIIERRNICKACPFNSARSMAAGLYTTKRKDLHCSICECNINLMTCCLDCTCSIKEFNEKNNYNIPIRWNQIN